MLPESVSDATMLHWHVEAGQAVRRDDNLVDIETEKVVLEVPAPRDGVITEILRTEGDTVLGDDVIALFEAWSWWLSCRAANHYSEGFINPLC